MSFARQFLIYGVAGALSRLASFLLVPLYTRTFNQGEYGRLEVVLSTYMLAVLLIGLQGESALARDYFLARKESREREVIWGALALALGGLFLSAIAALIAWRIGLPRYLANSVVLLLAAALFTHLMGIELVVARFAERAGLYAIFSVIDVAITSLSSLVLIVGMKMGLAGALLGLILGKAAVVALAWPITIGMPRRSEFARLPWRAMAAYSLPTMPAVLLNWLQTVGNRIVWSGFYPLGLVAVASVSIRVAAAFGLLVYAFRLAWEPFAFRMLDEQETASSMFASILQYVALGSFALAGAATMAGPLLTALFAPAAYRDAAALIGILMMGQVWLIVMLVTQMGIHGARVTSRIAWAYLIGAVVNVAVLALLAPVAGLGGTAWGALAGSVTTAIGAAYFSNWHFGTRFPIRLLAALTVVTASFGAVSNRFPAWGETMWPHPLVAVAAASGLAVLWWTGMDASDRARTRTAARIRFCALRRFIRSSGTTAWMVRPRCDTERDLR